MALPSVSKPWPGMNEQALGISGVLQELLGMQLPNTSSSQSAINGGANLGTSGPRHLQRLMQTLPLEA